MLPHKHPDRIHAAFDDHRLVVNAGVLLSATLALRLGLGELVDQHRRQPVLHGGRRRLHVCRASVLFPFPVQLGSYRWPSY